MEQEARKEPEMEAHGAAEEAGRKGGGGAMAAAVGVPYAMERAGAAFWTRDLVRWGPIWAGLLLALGIQLVLGSVGLGIALSAYNPASAAFADQVFSLVSIWNVVSGLIGLFVGGYIAGRMAAVMGLRNGFVQGSVVWALALALGVMLSAMGVSGLLGAAPNLGTILGRGMGTVGPEIQRFVRSAAIGTWWFVVGAILAWIAAAGGGILGAAAHVEEIEEAGSH